MMFRVVDNEAFAVPDDEPACYLIHAEWNDWWEYETLFQVIVVDPIGVQSRIGYTKIAKFGLQPRFDGVPTPTPMPPGPFRQLSDEYFSLAGGENFYQSLAELPEGLGDRIAEGLRDVAADPPRLQRAADEHVMTRSLLRDVNASVSIPRFARILRRDVTLTPFTFSYDPPRRDAAAAPVHLDFRVVPDSNPPTNVHVIIGRNGVGKTSALQGMARSLVRKDSTAERDGVFGGGGNQAFSGVLTVTFSAFDPFGPIAEAAVAEHSVGYSYLGLRSSPRPKAPPRGDAELKRVFVKSALACRVGARRRRWGDALRALESDPLFQDYELTQLTDAEVTEDEARQQATRLYGQLSSGHKIVLLTITWLVERVDERTLILLDEPEAHLHPPLLSAFVRGLSELLRQRNGVAIIATHSPVVLQEVPASCVWVLDRTGDAGRASRPVLETFGENVGILTTEVFGLELTESGFHKLLKKAVSENRTYEQVLEAFGGQLGTEARAVVRALTTRGAGGE